MVLRKKEFSIEKLNFILHHMQRHNVFYLNVEDKTKRLTEENKEYFCDLGLGKNYFFFLKI